MTKEEMKDEVGAFCAGIFIGIFIGAALITLFYSSENETMQEKDAHDTSMCIPITSILPQDKILSNKYTYLMINPQIIVYDSSGQKVFNSTEFYYGKRFWFFGGDFT